MYSGRVLVGFWFDKLQLESERRAQLELKRSRGELPYQRKQRLINAFVRPVPLPAAPSDPPACIKYGQGVLLHAPEIVDLTYLYEGTKGCPDEPTPWGPRQYGLVLAATASHFDLKDGIEDIRDGCPVACSPARKPTARNVFTILSARGKSEGEPVGLGDEFYLQMKQGHQTLYLRSEVPRVDGVFGPFYHNPLRLNLTRDGYTKWRALHWNRHKRFETEHEPILPCMRIVIQHVMTGKCLAAENLRWHRSLLGFECGISVHTYSDVHRNETSECIWNIITEESAVAENKSEEKDSSPCPA